MSDSSTSHPRDPGERGDRAGRARILIQVLLGFVLPLTVLSSAIAYGYHLLHTGPKAERQPRPPVPRLVQAETVRPTTEPIIVEAMGVVVPARELNLTPQVSGAIAWVSPKFKPGGFFAAGEVMLKIDDADYRIFVKQREADIAQIQADIAIERGRQTVARGEYELLNEEFDAAQRSLVLREPQLAALNARLQQAQSQLEAAELDLNRTQVRAPFNAQIAERFVELGTQVSTATVLAAMNGTDRYWVRATLPVNQLPWLQARMGDHHESGTQDAHRASVSNPPAWGAKPVREGFIDQLQPTLETDGRMAQVLVAVDDPLNLQPAAGGGPQPPSLLLGSFVHVDLQGREAENVFALPRSWLRQGDTVWLVDAQNRLQIQPVGVLYRGRQTVLVQTGLRDGNRVVTSDIPAPVAGMSLRETQTLESVKVAG